ncbi:MAG: right-handed parallel beta-helix repeat-containing protein [Mobilitalea sp.]
MTIWIDDFVKDRMNASEGIGLAIREAVKQGADLLRFGAGEYRLTEAVTINTKSIAHDDGCGDIQEKDCHILLKDMQGIALCGAEDAKTILTGYNSGRIGELLPSLLWADNCTDLTIKNLCFSRRPETAYSGLVEYIKEDVIGIKLLQEEESPDELGAYCMNRYDIKARRLIGESLTFGFGYEKRFQKIKERHYQLRDAEIAKKIQVGEGLSFHQSGKTDFLLFFGGCDNLELENIWVQNTNGFAILTENCRGITGEKVKIAPPATQFFTGPRDGWKIYRCSGKVRINNCHFEGVRMDGQNVQSNYLAVEKILDERTLLCRCKYAPLPLLENSDLYLRKEALEHRMVITNWQLVKGRMEEAKQAAEASAGAIVTGSRNHISLYRIEVAEKLPGEVVEESLLTAGCWEPEEYICTNSVFRNIAGAAHLIRCRNVVLEHNIYENIMCAGIMLGAELDTHSESDHVADVLIQNNHFRNIGTKPRYGNYGCACIGIKSQGFRGPWNKRIRIENNLFEDSGRGIEICDAREIVIKNNLYKNIKEEVFVEEETSMHILREDAAVSILGKEDKQ